MSQTVGELLMRWNGVSHHAARGAARNRSARFGNARSGRCRCVVDPSELPAMPHIGIEQA